MVQQRLMQMKEQNALTYLSLLLPSTGFIALYAYLQMRRKKDFMSATSEENRRLSEKSTQPNTTIIASD